MHHKFNNFIVLVTFWFIEIIFNLGCIGFFFMITCELYFFAIFISKKKKKKWCPLISHLNVLCCPNR